MLPLLTVEQRGSLEHIVVAKSVTAQQKGFEEKAGGTHEGLLGIVKEHTFRTLRCLEYLSIELEDRVNLWLRSLHEMRTPHFSLSPRV